jgi:3-phosphoshikimate 1-carboxyvinyltransferase
MNVKIEPSMIQGEIHIRPSKSLTHRYLVASSLCKETSAIVNLDDSNDIKDTIDALKCFNVQIHQNHITGGDLKIMNHDIFLKESATTLRFMIPFSMLFHDYVTFYGENRLNQRPLDTYKEAFREKAVKFEYLSEHYLPLKVRGKLKGGYYKLKGDVSSQFISGLMMILPTLKTDSVIEIEGPFESKSYVDLTKDVLHQFGVEVIEVLPYYYIRGNQTFNPLTVTVEGDYSSAANFMLLGILHDEVRLKGLNPNSLQGDFKMIDILKSMGGDIHVKDDVVISKKSKLYATQIDLSQIPDLGPILFVAASLAEGISEFTGFSRLRLKESDRVSAMIDNLRCLGINIDVTEKKIKIHGSKSITGGITLDGYKDHRIIMALTVISTVSMKSNTIKEIEYIDKSYPHFFKDLETLGGIITHER